MGETVIYYWDVAFLLNGLVLLPWLWATARLAGRPVRWPRLLLTAALGGAGAVWAELGGVPLRHPVGVLIGTLLLLRIAYGSLRPSGLIRCFTIFILIGALAAGLALLGTIQTGAVSAGVLVGLSLALVGGKVILEETRGRVRLQQGLWVLRVTEGDRFVELRAFLDTGHQLRAPLSGLPVILAAPDGLSPILPEQVLRVLAEGTTGLDGLPEEWRRRVQLIPFRTVAGEGILPAIRPGDLWLAPTGGPPRRVEALVGLATSGLDVRGAFQALLPPALVESFRVGTAWEVESG
jgi:stage II sporulation protein GA (sporulation sigma-E factor processing peptidase)